MQHHYRGRILHCQKSMEFHGQILFRTSTAQLLVTPPRLVLEHPCPIVHSTTGITTHGFLRWFPHNEGPCNYNCMLRPTVPLHSCCKLALSVVPLEELRGWREAIAQLSSLSLSGGVVLKQTNWDFRTSHAILRHRNHVLQRREMREQTL